jgi:hypothetical protein
MFRPTEAIIRFCPIELKWTKPDDGLYWPKHVVSARYNIYHLLAIVVLLTVLPYPFYLAYTTGMTHLKTLTKH